MPDAAASARSDWRRPLGRTLALLAAGAQVVAVFVPWSPQVSALDLTLRGFGPGVAQPTVGTSLVVLAAVVALPALVSDVAWPRAVSALGTGGLALVWLARGPSGAVTPGVAVALSAAVVHLAAAGLGGGSPVPAPPPRGPGGSGTGEGGGGGDRLEASGHRQLDHTADAAFEAWGRTRTACFAQAVLALVASFADTAGVRATDRHEVSLAPGDHDDVLVDLLDEVVYLVDVRGAVPVEVDLEEREDGGLHARLGLAGTEAVRPAGAVPKAITYHGLEVAGDEDGWRCRVTVDV